MSFDMPQTPKEKTETRPATPEELKATEELQEEAKKDVEKVMRQFKIAKNPLKAAQEEKIGQKELAEGANN